MCADCSSGGRGGAFVASNAFREFDSRFEAAFGDTFEECCEERVERKRYVCCLFVLGRTCFWGFFKLRIYIVINLFVIYVKI